MQKTRDLIKKIGDIKGIFHARMGTVKDRNSKDLTEPEENKRWQEYTAAALIIGSIIWKELSKHKSKNKSG